MGFLGARLGAAWRGLIKGDIPPSANPLYGELAAFVEVYGSRQSRSGRIVNTTTALEVATVFGILRVLGDGIAQPPLKVYRSRPDGRGADPATDHPLYQVLHLRPNFWQSSFAFRETMMLHLVLCSNFYAYKNMVGTEIRELIPLDPKRVEVIRRPDLSLQYYLYNDAGQKKEIPIELIWHVRGPSWNSWMGLDAVVVAREAIGLAMAIEVDQADFYKDGMRAAGTFSVEGSLGQERHQQLDAWIKKHNAETPRAPLILDNGAKFLQQTITGVNAQTLEQRKFQVEEICRIFRVMPIMVGFSDKTTTYASAEQMFLAHVVHTLAPWVERIEQAINTVLLSEADRQAGYYAKFNLNGLMRGAAKDQAEYFAKALGAGGTPAWMTPNEVRALLEMNPVDGGDELPKPSNSPQPEPAAP